jgi:hypothetical protein
VAVVVLVDLEQAHHFLLLLVLSTRLLSALAQAAGLPHLPGLTEETPHLAQLHLLVVVLVALNREVVSLAVPVVVAQVLVELLPEVQETLHLHHQVKVTMAVLLVQLRFPVVQTAVLVAVVLTLLEVTQH